MKTQSDIITEVLVRLNQTTTAAFYTDAMLSAWTDQAHKWAAAQHKWPFTEGRATTTYTTTEEWNFEGYKADSFRIVQVGTKRLNKLAYEDYLIFKESEPSASDRVFSDYGNTLFINTAVDSSGTLTVWGQYTPATLDATDPTVQTVFTPTAEEGNDAIVEKVLYYAKVKEKKMNEAAVFETQAKLKLEELWKRIQDEQYAYQTHRDRGGMFKRIDVLSGLQNDEVWKRDQFN